MLNKYIITALTMIGLLSVAVLTYGQELSNYLIVNNIGNFIASKNPSSGKGAGLLVGADHFDIDHADTTYRITYFNKQSEVRPKIQITQHVGGDSDKWLLHEIEKGFRDSDMARLGLLHKAVSAVKQGTGKLLMHGIGGGGYRWLSSNNVVVDIAYVDLQGGKPEPAEIIQAYLAKFPSIIPPTFVLDGNHDVQWIKDEMERRLWLCDKWIAQIQPSDPKLSENLKKVIESMLIFFKYKEKYYVSPTADTEKNLLVSYVTQRDNVSVQAKLAEYKKWWADHKSDEIVLL